MFRVISARLNPQRSVVIFNRNLTSDTQQSKSNAPKSPPSSSIPDVPGFTNKVVEVPDYPVGFAGAAKEKEYKNPEYFCYHVDSFGDSMVELEKYRLPAPSNKKKTK